MEKEFIPYHEALALKELGFDEPCVATFHDNSGGEIEFTFGMFHHPKKNSEANTVSGTFIGKNGCYAPLYQQAFRWFREEHCLRYNILDTNAIHIFDKNKKEEEFNNTGIVFNSYHTENQEYNTYEEAELACLKKLVEIAKEKK